MRLPQIFSQGMVVQRDAPIAVWGWADPDEVITVSMAGLAASARATPDGRWKLSLPSLPAGGPHTLTVSGSTTLTIPDVLVGEVWLASGQSNMEWPLSLANDAEMEIANSNDPLLRHCLIPRRTSDSPLDDGPALWAKSCPGNSGSFSAVGYFFARTLRSRLGVPVGVINATWGGTVAEAWTSEAALAAQPALRHHINAARLASRTPMSERVAQYQAQRLAWLKKFPQDSGNAGLETGWASPDFNDESWGKIVQPGAWGKTTKLVHGCAWFRHEVEIPDSWLGKDLLLRPGRLDKSDITYFNGVKVGSLTWEECDLSWNTPREYTIPSSLVRPGRNVIAIRVWSAQGDGGMMGASIDICAPHLPEAPSIDLGGPWRFHVERDLGAVVAPAGQPASPENCNVPTHLFNGMIAPIIPFSLRGAIWYQGESNAGNPAEYKLLFPTMIRDWRQQWQQGEFPFLFTQLANWQASVHPEFMNSYWAELREAQTEALKLPNTGMAVAIDIGEANDIHPRNKQDVGLRLALNALAITYGQATEHIGPRYETMQAEGQRIRLTFSHASGLHARGEDPAGFGIAGKDRIFHKASAKIDGNTAVVSSSAVPAPVAVRYAWGDNPACNLYNDSGLPMEPFRTDNWTMGLSA